MIPSIHSVDIYGIYFVSHCFSPFEWNSEEVDETLTLTKHMSLVRGECFIDKLKKCSRIVYVSDRNISLPLKGLGDPSLLDSPWHMVLVPEICGGRGKGLCPWYQVFGAHGFQSPGSILK